jgi:hypothetical protein
MVKKIAFLLVLFLFLCIPTAQAKEQMSKEDLNVSYQTMGKFANHLEFLGYRIEKKTDTASSENPYFYAYHTTSNNIIVSAFAPNYYLFRTNLICVKPGSAAMADFVNKANKVMDISRFYWEPDTNTKGTNLRFEAIYMGDYSKQTFGLFIDMLRRDQNNILYMENYKKIFLNNE